MTPHGGRPTSSRGPLTASQRDVGGRRARPVYLHGGRRVLSLAGALALGLPALLVGLPIALVNLWLHRGRALFSQPRVGRDGRVFRIWKFRTYASGHRADEGARAFARWSRGEGEVTRFGGWLRDRHLDELPQLWNVLAGDMDLVGPRPEMVEVHRWASASIPEFAQRNVARPGLTGLAQVTHGYAGRDVEAYRRKLTADLEYLAAPSLRRDLALLARTVVWLVRPKRAGELR